MDLTITIKFTTDRTLTRDELDNLFHAAIAQIAEPEDNFDTTVTYAAMDPNA